MRLPGCWIDAAKLESVLIAQGGPHESRSSETLVTFPAGCKVKIDAAVRLLSLLNQLDAGNRIVRLEFDEGEPGVMGYLNRMGFFDRLAPRVDVRPYRPAVSTAKRYSGRSNALVEIAQVNRHARDATLLTRLAEALRRGCHHRQDAAELAGAAWTIFAELIDNVYSHSETKLDGYAALQVYPRGNDVQVAVSDSGLGILETLRPSVERDYPLLSRRSDLDLLVEIFRHGLSRHGADRGCGLKGAAAKAMKFGASLDLRLAGTRVLLAPEADGYCPVAAHCRTGLSLIQGTHICFSFRLS